MALIPCHDCSRLLSPMASHCPQCGRPTADSTSRGSSTSMLRLTLSLLLAGSTAGLLWRMAQHGLWIPGLLFGIGFSLSTRLRGHLLLSFSSISGIIYVIAYFTGQYIPGFLGEEGVFPVLPEGGILAAWGTFSGAIGAFLLLQAIALFHDVRIPLLSWSAILAGSGIGLVFVEAVARTSKGFGKDPWEDMVIPIIGFALWQATVGVLSYKAVVNATDKRPSGAFSLWLQQVLTGPAIQFLGLIATLLTFVQMLWSSK